MKLSLLFFFFLGFPVIAAPVGPAEHPTYEEFIRRLDAGEVRSVSIDPDSRIESIYSVAAIEHRFGTFGETGSANDPLLTRLLAAKGVPATLAVPREAETPGGVALKIAAFFGVPLLILICIFNNTRTLKRLEKRIPPGPGW